MSSSTGQRAVATGSRLIQLSDSPDTSASWRASGPSGRFSWVGWRAA
ncbi:hypothetical protein ACFFX0_25515 [Citricoccus parietis]|uniref:Uncharacterized protein n=1 Tax=Citricoccus parietis TaxID=592307 RepID=A0ABV5G606_9MICC